MNSLDSSFSSLKLSVSRQLFAPEPKGRYSMAWFLGDDHVGGATYRELQHAIMADCFKRIIVGSPLFIKTILTDTDDRLNDWGLKTKCIEEDVIYENNQLKCLAKLEDKQKRIAQRVSEIITKARLRRDPATHCPSTLSLTPQYLLLYTNHLEKDIHRIQKLQKKINEIRASVSLKERGHRIKETDAINCRDFTRLNQETILEKYQVDVHNSELYLRLTLKEDNPDIHSVGTPKTSIKGTTKSSDLPSIPSFAERYTTPKKKKKPSAIQVFKTLSKMEQLKDLELLSRFPTEAELFDAISDINRALNWYICGHGRDSQQLVASMKPDVFRDLLQKRNQCDQRDFTVVRSCYTPTTLFPKASGNATYVIIGMGTTAVSSCGTPKFKQFIDKVNAVYKKMNVQAETDFTTALADVNYIDVVQLNNQPQIRPPNCSHFIPMDMPGMVNLNFSRQQEQSLSGGSLIIPETIIGINIESDNVPFPIQLPRMIAGQSFQFYLQHPETSIQAVHLPTGQSLWGLFEGFGDSNEDHRDCRFRNLRIGRLSMVNKLDILDVHVSLPPARQERSISNVDKGFNHLSDCIKGRCSAVRFFDKDKNLYLVSIINQHAYVVPAKDVVDKNFKGVLPQLFPDYVDGVLALTSECLDRATFLKIARG